MSHQSILSATDLSAEGFRCEELTTKDNSNYEHYLTKIERIFDRATLGNSKLQKRSYQIETAAMYCTRRDNIAALSQGLGKTLIASLLIAALYDRHSTPGSIHICIPTLTMLPRWLEDLGLLFGNQDICVLASTDLHGKKDPRKSNLQRWAKILIYTHDFVRQSKAASHTYAHYLKWSCPPSLLIIDEIHHFKDKDSLKYRNLDLLARSAKRVLGLSGTLAEGNLDGLSSILQLVYQRDWVYFRQPKKLNDILGSIVNLGLDYRSGDTTTDKSAKRLQGVNEDRLSDYFNLMSKYVHRLSIDDPNIRGQIRLPTAKFTTQVVSMSREQRAAYDLEIQAKQSSLTTLAANPNISTTASLKFQTLLNRAIEICNVGSSGTLIPKADLALAFVGEAKKTVVFCQYISSARYIHELLVASWGTDRIIRVYAKDPEALPQTQSPQQRWGQIQKFESDPNVKAGVFSLNLAAEAIDLVSADRVVIYCAPWSAVKFDQCLRRVLRPGNQNAQIEIIVIYHHQAIDCYQMQLVSAKQNVGRLLLDYEVSSENEVDRDLIAPMLSALQEGI